MKISFLLPFIGLAFFSCGEPVAEEKIEPQEIIEENLSLEELTKRKVEAQLSIPGSENYGLEIHKAQFDGDGIEDAVILVNRVQFAHNEALRKNRADKEEEMGYTGNFNHLFYYDGATNKVSRPINISSSAFAPLKITIENIHSQSYKDFTIDYRITDNCYRNFYTIFRGVPKLVFQWSVFELENPSKESYTYFEYAPGTYSQAKDIVIFKGKLDSPKPDKLRTEFPYSISKNGDMEHLFFYNPKEGKYFTKK